MTSFVESDFENMKSFLKKKGIISEEWLKDNQDKLATFHELVSSFVVWNHHLRKKEEHQRYFIGETRSDSINIILAVLSGSKKAVNLLLRGIIENTLNHIYYFDHPIEFQLISINDEYLTFKELISYVKKHPLMAGCLEGTQVLSRLEQGHKTTSKFVHSQSPQFMQNFQSLCEIKFDPRFFDWAVKKFKSVTSDLNILLVLLHYEDFKTMHRDYRKLVMKVITRENKKILSTI
jgi:hypothetical protein